MEQFSLIGQSYFSLVYWKFSHPHCVQSGCGSHPTFYRKGTEGFFTVGNAAGAWSWSLTSV